MNYAVRIDAKKNLKVFKHLLKDLRADLKSIITSTNKITNFQGRLLE